MANRVEIAELVYKYTGDDGSLNKTLTKVDKTLAKLTKSLRKLDKKLDDTKKKEEETDKQTDKLGKRFLSLGKIIAGVVVAGFALFTRSAIRAASDAEETAQKFGVVFRTVSTEANKAAQDLAKNYGLSSTASKQLLADTGDLLVGFGFTREAALSYSTDIQKLSVDLASFTNFSGGAEGASAALTKALLGETEAAKSLGIAIDQSSKDFNTRIKQLQEQEGLTLRQAKAQDIYNQIILQSRDAQGDFARSSTSLANTTRQIAANLTDLSTSAGQEALPAVTKLARNFNEFIKTSPAVQAAFRGIGRFIGFLADAAATAIAGLDLLLIKFSKVQLEAGNVEEQRLRESLQVGGDALPEQERLEIERQLAEFDKSKVERRKELDKLEEQARNRLRGETEELDKQINKFQTRGSILPGGATQAQKENEAAQKAADDRRAIVQGLLEETERLGETEVQRIQREEARKTNILRQAAADNIITADQAADAITKISEDAARRQLQAQLQTVQQIGGQVGNILNSAFQAIQQFQQNALADTLARIDEQEQRALEAAGVAEETTQERLQREIEEAEAAGDVALANEKRTELKREQIRADFDKKRRLAEYEANVQAWELSLAQAVVQGIQAPLNAFTSALAIPQIGPFIAPGLAAAAAATSAAYVAAVAGSKPQRPKFAEGGIVPGTASSGDSIEARLNSGELVVNEAGQGNLLRAINGQGAGGGTRVIVNLAEEPIIDVIQQASTNGDIIIDARAIQTGV